MTFNKLHAPTLHAPPPFFFLSTDMNDISIKQIVEDKFSHKNEYFFVGELRE